MKRIYYDLETTGLSKSDEIIQVAALVVEEGKLTMHSQYYMPHGDIKPSAARVNGLSKKKLEILSGGITFEEGIFDTLELLLDPDAEICGYNSIKFDDKMLESNLLRIGYNGRMPVTERDVLVKIRELKMQGSHTLNKMLAYSLNKEKLTKECFDAAFCKLVEMPGALHNAAYDAYATLFVDATLTS